MKIELDQENLASEFKYSQERIKLLASLIEEYTSNMNGVISCKFIAREEMQTLNREHRGKDYITDVLAFSYLHNRMEGDDLLGEVVISFEKAKEQAEENGVDVKKEVDMLFIHGCLHVLGYDHEEEADAKIMFPLQEKILNEFYVA